MKVITLKDLVEMYNNDLDMNYIYDSSEYEKGLGLYYDMLVQDGYILKEFIVIKEMVEDMESFKLINTDNTKG